MSIQEQREGDYGELCDKIATLIFESRKDLDELAEEIIEMVMNDHHVQDIIKNQ